MLTENILTLSRITLKKRPNILHLSSASSLKGLTLKYVCKTDQRTNIILPSDTHT